MDHSYSSDRDGSRERERLHRQDHCYFAIADKTPLVVQRKVQQLQQRAEQLQLTSVTPIGSGCREDHTYGRQVACLPQSSAQGVTKRPQGKENSTTRGNGVAPECPRPAVTLHTSTLTGSPCLLLGDASPTAGGQSTAGSPPSAVNLPERPRQDHTYFESSEITRPVRKKTADKSRYDHVYCSATGACAEPGALLLGGDKDGVMIEGAEGQETGEASVIETEISVSDPQIVLSASATCGEFTPAEEQRLTGSRGTGTETTAPPVISCQQALSSEVEVVGAQGSGHCRLPLSNLTDICHLGIAPQFTTALGANLGYRLPLTPLTDAYYPGAEAPVTTASDMHSLAFITADHDYHSAS